jgi:hypothetical protein
MLTKGARNTAAVSEEDDLLKDALAVASEQRAGETAAHLKSESEAVRKARILKKCSGAKTWPLGSKPPGRSRTLTYVAAEVHKAGRSA